MEEAREGPPAAASSTSTLLQEISTLRTRLKDLEDDNKSTFSVAGEEGQLLVMLRKDLAQVQQEKAKLECEFLNQMAKQAAEHAKKVEALENKLEKAQGSESVQILELQDKLETMEMKLKTSEEVNKALNGKLIEAQHDNEAERYMILLEQEREMHTKEIEQMKQNLATTDEEIGESRREMDHLHHQLEENQADKESLEQQAMELKSRYQEIEEQLQEAKENEEDVRQLLEEKIDIIEDKDEEIGEMNDAIITLEEHKELLVAEVTDIRLQLDKTEDENNMLKKQLEELPEPPTPDKSITPSERRELENSVEHLEERIEIFNQKLSEKDNKIEGLSTSLAEERKTNKKMKKEIKALRASSKSSKTKEQSPKKSPKNSPSRDQVGEVTFLRKQNKILNDEIKTLRRRCDIPPSSPRPSPARAPTPKRSVARTKSANSPGISNLVASFERRIASTSTPAGTPGDEKDSIANVPSIHRTSSHGDFQNSQPEMDTLRRELKAERATVAELQSKLESASYDLERELASERATVIELQEELDSEREAVDEIHEEAEGLRRELEVKKELVNELRQQLGIEVAQANNLRGELTKASGGVTGADTDLKEQLEKSQKEVDRLQKIVQDLEHEQSELERNIDAAKEEADQFRQKLANIDGDRKEMEKKVSHGELAQAELAEKLRSAKHEADELKKKIEEIEGERNSLKQKVETDQLESERMKSDAAMEAERLRQELNQSRQQAYEEEKKEEEAGEELVRLRSQVAALQPELDQAMVEIETLESVISGLKTHSEERHALKEQLSAIQVEKVGMELEYTNAVNDLENELNMMERAAEEEVEDREQQIDVLLEKVASHEKEIKRLEEERTHLCTSMNDVSMTRKGEIEELQDEIMDLTTQTTAKSREIESLKRQLSEKNGSNESVVVLKKRIKELEEELKVLTWSTRNKGQQGDIDALRKENARLRDAIRSVRMDRKNLNDRLDSLLAEKSSSKSAQVLRDRNSSLKAEVEKLTKRLRKMEDSITRFAI